MPPDEPEDQPLDRRLAIVAVVFWLIVLLVCCGLWQLDLPACWLGC